MAETCLSNATRQSRRTPSTLMSSASGRSTPATFTNVREDADCSWLAVPIISASDLSGFSWRSFCINQSLTSEVHVARVDRPAAMLLARFARCSWVSSACWWWRTPCDTMTSAAGLQYTVNSSGPSTEPCGMPTSSLVSGELRRPSLMNCLRSVRYDQIHDNAVPDTPNSDCSRCSSVWWQTVSKAAERSRPMSTVTCFSSADVYTLFRTSSRVVSVQWPCL